jgi:ArsR family transcriptional regulator
MSTHSKLNLKTKSSANEYDIDRTSKILRAISHPVRLKILCFLRQGEACVQEILSEVGTTQSYVSQHLILLRDKNVLTSRRNANRVFYRLGESDPVNLIAKIQGAICSECSTPH